jgi:retron-type reverse transcriptase
LTIFSLTNLIKAYLSCRKRKRVTKSSLDFELNFETKLLALEKELKNRSYSPKHSICFAVKYPKPREIFAGNFQDRIVHHLLVNHLEPIFEPTFIDQSYACRKNKGTHKATGDIKKSLNKITKNQTKSGYYLQMDIQSFFCSINKQILYQTLKKKIAKKFTSKNTQDLSWLAKTIIFHNPTNNYYLKGDPKLLETIPEQKSLFSMPAHKGLPIGNLTSQFFANVYLNELDQYAKRELKIKHYFRYADDMLILSTDIRKLKHFKNKIETFLTKNLDLNIHPKKTKFGSIYNGIDFVGYIIKPNCTLIRNRTVNNLKTKLHYFNQGLLLISNNQIQEAIPLSEPPTQAQLKRILATVNSYYGLMAKADCYRLRKNLYRKHFKKLKKYLEPIDDYKYFKIKKQ